MTTQKKKCCEECISQSSMGVHGRATKDCPCHVEKEGWEAEFDEILTNTNIMLRSYERDAIKSFIRRTREEAYYEGEKNEFHNMAGRIAEAVAEDRKALRGAIEGMKEKCNHCGEREEYCDISVTNDALDDVLSLLTTHDTK